MEPRDYRQRLRAEADTPPSEHAAERLVRRLDRAEVQHSLWELTGRMEYRRKGRAELLRRSKEWLNAQGIEQI